MVAHVEAWTGFRDPVYKKITISEKILQAAACLSQTVSVNNEAPFVMDAVSGIEGSMKLANETASSFFTNSDSFNCPVTYYLVTDGACGDGRPIASLEAYTDILNLNADGLVEVDEAKYSGMTLAVRIKALTPFGEPVYKDFEVIERVPEVESMTVEYTLIGLGIALLMLIFCCVVYRMWCKGMMNSRKKGYGHPKMVDTSLE